MNRRSLFVFLSVATLACEGAPTGVLSPSDAAALTVTDAAVFLLASDPGTRTEMGLTFSNRTQVPVWFLHCGGPRPWLEKLEDDQWRRVVFELRTLCLQATQVDAGEQFRVRYGLRRSSVEVEELAGTYRLVWEGLVWNYKDEPGLSSRGDPLPLDLRTSNTFRLQLRPDPAI